MLNILKDTYMIATGYRSNKVREVANILSKTEYKNETPEYLEHMLHEKAYTKNS